MKRARSSGSYPPSAEFVTGTVVAVDGGFAAFSGV